jgi:uncharacterized Zn-binding protein involved in type VI secretion
LGQPAARVGDTTSHGTPLGPGPGCLTVKIGGMPAWRASDTHACPLSDGPKPHVGGAVTVGSVTVKVGGMPAARQGDMVVEAGPPNTIAAGAVTVMIG